MVLVFDKKTPENAFNDTKSERVVGVLHSYEFCTNCLAREGPPDHP